MKPNYFKETHTKKQIVLSHAISLRGNNFPYSIDENGKVTEHYDPKYYSEFLKSPFDRNIIPILLINEGWLSPDPISGRLTNWLGKDYSKPDETSVRRDWRSHRNWSSYSDKQVESTIKLCRELCDRFDIPKKSIGHNVIVENIEKFKGVTCVSNYSELFTALSPAFDFNKFQEGLES